MSRRGNTLKATKAEVKKIKKRLEELPGWTGEENSQALVEASRVLIDPILKLNTYCLSLSELKRLINEDKLYVPKSARIDFSKFEESCYQEKKEEISSLEIDDLIQEGQLRAKGISSGTFRKFKEGTPINKDAFIAFWKALGFNRDEISELSNQTAPYPQKSQSSERLYRALLSFDHRAQCEIIQNLAKKSCRTGAILIPYSSIESQTWLMKRIESEVIEYSQLQARKVLFPLNSQSVNPNIFSFWSRFTSETQNQPLSQCLAQENLIIVVQDIDVCDRHRLLQILNSFWQPLVNELSSTECPGFLLLYLVDRGAQNDWRDDPSLFSNILTVPAVEKFYSNDFAQELPKVAAKVQQSLEQKDIDEIWQNSQEGIPKVTLKAIYKKFNCRFERESRWQQYG